MIFSSSRKFIFFAVPKTGTHAVRAVLRPFLGDEDWEQQMLMNRNENIGKMSSLCDLFRLFQIHIWQFAVCLVNAMQAVVREGGPILGGSMPVTHK